MTSNDQTLTTRIQQLETELRETNAAKRDLWYRLASESTTLWQELTETNTAKREIEDQVTSLLHKLEEANTAKRELEEKLVEEGNVRSNELAEIKAAKNELEQRLLHELAEANVVKYQLSVGRETTLRELVEAKEICAALEEKLQQADDEKRDLLEELKRADRVIEKAAVLEQILEEASQEIASHQDKTDGQEVLINTLEESLHELQSNQAVLQQELEMARLNDERTVVIERELKKAEDKTQAMVTKLEHAVVEQEMSKRQLSEAMESKRAVEQELAEAQAKIEGMVTIEQKLEIIEEMVKDDSYKYDEYTAKLTSIEDTMSQALATHQSDTAAMSEYTAHIRSLEDELASVRDQMESLRNKEVSDKPNIREEIEKIVRKIDQCVDYQNIYAMESEFNQLGLTVQTTSNNRMILCKLQNGKAIAEHVVDDYIFIGGLDQATKELSERALLKIKDFVRANAGPASKIENISKVWRNGLRMYEATISIVNEQKALSVDALVEASPNRE